MNLIPLTAGLHVTGTLQRPLHIPNSAQPRRSSPQPRSAGRHRAVHTPPHVQRLWAFELKQRLKKKIKIQGAANAQLEKHKVPRTANPINNNHNPSSGRGKHEPFWPAPCMLTHLGKHSSPEAHDFIPSWSTLHVPSSKIFTERKSPGLPFWSETQQRGERVSAQRNKTPGNELVPEEGS